jgi:hypothetical protein
VLKPKGVKMYDLLDTLKTYTVGTVSFIILELILIATVVVNWAYLSTASVWGEGYDTYGICGYLVLAFGTLFLVPTAMAIEELADTYLV